MFFFDQRWLGVHGIGRFASELDARLLLKRLHSNKVRPTSPLDVIFLSIWMLRNPKAILLSPGYNSPIIALNRYVLTVHDLNHLHLKDNSSLLKRIYYWFVLRRAVRNALKVLTVSEFSRNSIIQWAAVSPDRIVNVGNGVSASFGPIGEKFCPGFSYLLCVSNRKLHKNEDRLLRAFSIAKVNKEIKLVLTGKPTATLVRLSIELGIANRLIFLGNLNEAELAALYRGALALVFPSLYEGFGLPIVEAMASGVPVVTSNLTALPEVAGNAALLVNPLDVNNIADGIEKVTLNNDLRNALIERGFAQAKKFSWDLVAANVKKVLDEVEQGGRKR